MKKENAISIGNLLGSNLFNIMCVLGITALINEGVSYFRILEVLRLEIARFPEIIIIYKRPTKDLIKAMESIAK